METNVSLVERLQKEIKKNLDDLVDGNEKFALLDFPNHDNVGDAAIYVGELCYFRARGLKPSFVSDVYSHDDEKLTNAVGDGCIFMHGGGNFGDLWDWFHSFREKILERYRGRPIVQLPQTIYFRSQEGIDRTARLIERHGNYTLLVRDQRSLEFAQRWFACESRLCPDMAFSIGTVTPPKPSTGLFLNLRDDQEVSGPRDLSALQSRTDVRQSDWPPESADFQRATKYRAIVKAIFSGNLGGRAHMTELAYRERAEQRFWRGINLLGSGRQVITDRMHGHIMCRLADIDHCVLDNSYGKTSGLINSWRTCDSDRATLAPSFEEAVTILAARSRSS